MNIAIVGGGPVGLTTAISIVNDRRFDYIKNISIDLYEKRKIYTRDQFIVSGGTKGNLLEEYPDDLQEKLINNFSCYIDNPILDRYGYCFKKNPDENSHFSQTIEIKKLEKILYDYIKKNYKNIINIIHTTFTKNDVKKYNIIIGADGQKSFIRKHFIKSKFKKLKDYNSYILHIKYTDLSNKKYKISNKLMSNFKKVFKLKLKRKNYDEEDIQEDLDKKQYFEQDRFRLIRSDTNKTQFLLQISKTTYNKIKNIKTFGKLPKKVQNIVLINSFMMGSLPTSLNNTKINVYNTIVGFSEKSAIVKNKKLYALIGDSALTTHVFTGEGLNINFFLFNNFIFKFIKNKNFNIKNYNNHIKNTFEYNTQYKILLRYLPHTLLKKICSNLTLNELFNLLKNDLHFYDFNNNDYVYNIYGEIVKNLKKKYKNISDTEIKNELCFILRDKILKYYSYKLTL